MMNKKQPTKFSIKQKQNSHLHSTIAIKIEPNKNPASQFLSKTSDHRLP
jgi:hypothetical protein